MKFIVGNGEHLREKLRDFPSPWANWLLSARILVIGVIDDKIAAAYGIRGVLNATTAYVKEEYRGRGIGGQMFERAIDVARKRGVHFLTGEALSTNIVSLHICYRSGCKLVKHLKKRKTVLILWPLTFQGELTYQFLRIACFIVPDKLLERMIDWISEKNTLELNPKDF